MVARRTREPLVFSASSLHGGGGWLASLVCKTTEKVLEHSVRVCV